MNNKPGQRNTNNQLFLNAVEASSMSVNPLLLQIVCLSFTVLSPIRIGVSKNHIFA